MKSERAKFAGKSLCATNTHPQKPAQKNAELRYLGIADIQMCGEEPVYNMEVENYHNFSVNGGIIVHNCMDQTRYLCQTVLRRELR